MPKNEEIRVRLKWLIGLRVLIVTLILGSSLIFQIGFRHLPNKSTFYILIPIIYFLTIGYSIIINRFKWLVVFAYFQITVDLFLESILIYLTGGIDSPFSFLYLISIISTSMILYNKGVFIIASLCSILYGSIVDLQYYKIAPFIMESSLPASETLYILFLNVVSFFTVGGLSAHLAEKLRSTGEELREKDIGFTELQTFHENIVKSMSSGLITTDMEGKINLFNKASEEITGYSWDEVRLKKLYQIFDWQEIKEIFSIENNLDKLFRFDREVIKKDNTRIQVGMTISPLKNKEGKMTGIIAVFQDLTMIKEMEKEIGKKERLATIGEMAAGMAHEIRNPLASISGSIQILSQELITDEENRRLMEIALKETDRLNSIITEFLLYARPTSLNKERTDINELLLEI
ncbi:MAG: nitrogen regulation protein NR(II), partial [Nitrospirota bacterium]